MRRRGPFALRSYSSPAATPGRMAERGLLAALAGAGPVDASSRRRRRHRLNRGGDRQLNWALHVIALAQVRHHEQTRLYYQRLRTNGKTAREARRCVKRALARRFTELCAHSSP